MPAHDLHDDVAGGVAQLPDLRGKPLRRAQIGLSPMVHNLAPQRGAQRVQPVQRRRELPCPGVHLGPLRRAPSPVREEQRLAERDLQIELDFAAPVGVGQVGNQRQPAAEQRDGFRNRRARQGLPPGGEPIRDHLLGERGFGAVVGEQRRLGRNDLREPTFEGGGDIGMELLPAAAQQGAVGRVLHQRVLKGVFGVGRGAAPVDQLGADQLRQGVVELRRRHPRSRGDQLVRELPAQGGPDLRHLPRRRQAIEPSQERGLQARRDR
jgi:hypothetical protein